MENASKALIIAGAILLAILLISLGIYIFGQAQDTINNNGMAQAEITAFNQKFIKYEGQNKKGSEVRSLVQEVVSCNADENYKNDGVAITIGGNSGASATSSGSIINTRSYNISITEYDDKGRVKNINIDKNGWSTTP